MEGYFDEDDLHTVASVGSASDILAIIDTVKASSPVVPEERVTAFLNRKNEAKYTALHCSIFARYLHDSTHINYIYLHIFLEILNRFCVLWKMAVM